mgnify:CR=1 FL=1
MSEVQIVAFSVNGRTFGIEAMSIKRLIKCQDLQEVEDMPEYMAGYITVENEKIPVVDVGVKFDSKPIERSKNSKIIISGENGLLTGFLVDDVTELIKVDSSDIEETPEIVRLAGNTCVKKVAKKDGKLIIIVEINAVLSKEEKEKIHQKEEIH